MKIGELAWLKILSVYCSVSLSTFTLLCSHPTIYLQNFFNQMITSFPFLLTPGNYSTFVSMDLTILDTLMCGIIFSFCIWLILLVSMMFSTMLYHAPLFYSFFRLNNILLYLYHIFFVHWSFKLLACYYYWSIFSNYVICLVHVHICSRPRFQLLEISKAWHWWIIQ